MNIKLKHIIEIDGYLLKNYTLLSENEKKIALDFRNNNRKWMINNNLIDLKEHSKWIETLKTDQNTIYFLVFKDNIPFMSIDFHNINKVKKEAYWGYFLVTAFAIDVAVSPDRFLVALLAADPPGDEIPMEERSSRHLDRLRGRTVTEGALAASGQLAIGLGMEVASEAHRLGDREVFSFQDMGMAGSAFQFLPLATTQQVLAMIEDHLAEGDSTFEGRCGVTSGTQAALVLDLGEGFSSGTGDVFRHLGDRLEFAGQGFQRSRLVVAADASDVLVRRFLPCFDIGQHVVATSAELRLRGVFHGHEAEQPQAQGAGAHDDQDHAQEAEEAHSPGSQRAAHRLGQGSVHRSRRKLRRRKASSAETTRKRIAK